MPSKEEVIATTVYLILVLVIYITTEVLLDLNLPRDFILKVNDSVNISIAEDFLE